MNIDLNEFPFNGQKTYLVGVAYLAYAVGGVVLGMHDANHAVELILLGIGIISGRHALEKSTQSSAADDQEFNS